jgi:hypothetical protein
VKLQEHIMQAYGIPAASDNATVTAVSRGFRSAGFITLAAALLGALVGFCLQQWFGPATPWSIACLQIIGTSVLLLATIYVLGAVIVTWNRQTLIERVDRWIYCGGYILDTSVLVASLVWGYQAKSMARSAGYDSGRELSQREQGLLSGRGGLSHGNYYWVDLYNGNDDIVVTQIELVIVTTISKLRDERSYRTDVFVDPKSTEGFGFDIVIGDQGAQYEWRIKQAWGRPKK